MRGATAVIKVVVAFTYSNEKNKFYVVVKEAFCERIKDCLCVASQIETNVITWHPYLSLVHTRVHVLYVHCRLFCYLLSHAVGS